VSESIGIDFGSRTVKIVRLIGKNIADFQIFPTRPDAWEQVRQSLVGFEEHPKVATGYGRHFLSENLTIRRVTEIKACAAGAFFLFPGTRTILDVGGQDCKVICLNHRGKVVEFAMNDRCAAGTGRFLEIMARTFHMDLPEFVGTALSAGSHIAINSMCAVFAESEVISLITSGKPKEEIALGLHMSITGRLQAMLSRTGIEKDFLFVGGGAINDCLLALLRKKLPIPIIRPDSPQIIAAFGAALLAQ
jgi:predicted CoA-substrate-specific enzyme activase